MQVRDAKSFVLLIRALPIRREAHAQWKEYAMFATGDVRILPPRVIAQRVCVFPSLPQTLRQLNLVGPLLPVCVGR